MARLSTSTLLERLPAASLVTGILDRVRGVLDLDDDVRASAESIAEARREAELTRDREASRPPPDPGRADRAKQAAADYLARRQRELRDQLEA